MKSTELEPSTIRRCFGCENPNQLPQTSILRLDGYGRVVFVQWHDNYELSAKRATTLQVVSTISTASAVTAFAESPVPEAAQRATDATASELALAQRVSNRCAENGRSWGTVDVRGDCVGGVK